MLQALEVCLVGTQVLWQPSPHTHIRKYLISHSINLGTAVLNDDYRKDLGFSWTPVAFSTICGILFMVVMERMLCSRSTNTQEHQHVENRPATGHTEIRELARKANAAPPPHNYPASRILGPHQRRIYLFTFVLIASEVLQGISMGHRTSESDSDILFPFLVSRELMEICLKGNAACTPLFPPVY